MQSIRHHLQSAYALNDFRPRARRAFRILRPAFVDIRERKPWRRLRTRFDGWNVRFIAVSPGWISSNAKPFISVTCPYGQIDAESNRQCDILMKTKP
jgi:hypothetical protein